MAVWTTIIVVAAVLAWRIPDLLRRVKRRWLIFKRDYYVMSPALHQAWPQPNAAGIDVREHASSDAELAA
jgi:hypothetical protein